MQPRGVNMLDFVINFVINGFADVIWWFLSQVWLALVAMVIASTIYAIWWAWTAVAKLLRQRS